MELDFVLQTLFVLNLVLLLIKLSLGLRIAYMGTYLLGGLRLVLFF